MPRLTCHGPAAAGKAAAAGPRRAGLAAGTAQHGPRSQAWHQELKAKMVVEVKVFPGARTVDGKLGWLGESGKCWVSNV